MSLAANPEYYGVIAMFDSDCLLLGRADPEPPAFATALARYYDGIEDPKARLC